MRLRVSPEIDRIVDHRWWAGAIIQRHNLDALAHAEGREHQKVSPDAHPDRSPGPDYTLTAWDRAWLRERVIDQFRDRLVERAEKHGPLLAEPREEHLARELHAKARSYFDGRTHDQQRTHLVARRERLHAGLGMTAAHRRPPKHEDADLHRARQEHFDHETAMIADQVLLVDRHITTVTVEVDEARRLAAARLTELDAILAHGLDALVKHYTARVEEDIRTDAQGCLDIAEGRVPAPTS